MTSKSQRKGATLLAAAALLLLAAAGGAAAFKPFKVTGSYQHTEFFHGGLPGCSNCGNDTEYACSPSLTTGRTIGDWHNGSFSFEDKVPSGLVALEVSAKVYGAWSCDRNPGGSELSIVSMSLQDYTYLTMSASDEGHCECGHCSDPITFCGRHPYGLHNYKYGGSNVLQLGVNLTDPQGSSICVNRVEVSVSYGHPAEVEPATERLVIGGPLEDKPWAYGSECSDTNDGNDEDPPLVTLTFDDPFPSGYIVTQVQATWYGWGCLDGVSGYDTQVTMSLQDLDFGAYTSVDNACTGTDGQGDESYNTTVFHCQGSTLKSSFYQTGWPNYVYGGRNSLSGAIQYDGGEDLQWCATRFEVLLSAYDPSAAVASAVHRAVPGVPSLA